MQMQFLMEIGNEESSVEIVASNPQKVLLKSVFNNCALKATKIVHKLIRNSSLVLCYNRNYVIYTYNVTGMTCSGYQAKVQNLLSQVKGVQKVNVDLANGAAIIDMDHHVPTTNLQSALKDYPKYQLSEVSVNMPQFSDYGIPKEEAKSWLSIYKPILLIFAFIFVITGSIEFISGSFVWERWMQNFMAGFFIIFSFLSYWTSLVLRIVTQHMILSQNIGKAGAMSMLL